MHDSYEADHHIKNFFTVPLVHSLHFHFPAVRKIFMKSTIQLEMSEKSYKCDFTKYVVIMFWNYGSCQYGSMSLLAIFN